MILTRTPLRVSLAGGGTDLPGFYNRSFGAVVSVAIDKYVYVALNPKFDGRTRVSYSTTENVKNPMELKHDIIRESLISFNVDGVEVVTVADIPGNGTGLGSSSALAVGMMRALAGYVSRNVNAHPNIYAEAAYDVERECCLHSVGKQDHYAAAYGNMHYFQFNQDGSVTAELMRLSENKRLELENHLVLLWTGRNRNAQDILKAVEANMSTDRYDLAVRMRDIAVQMRDDLREGRLSNIGMFLDAGWKIKRQMAQGVTNDWIDQVYERAIAAGAQGGKICGAGGGGFFLFYGPLGLAPELEKATGLKHIPFKIDLQGSQVVYA